MYAAEIVLGLKSSYEGIILESAILCESQAEKWTEEQRGRYFDIASKCDKETLIQHHYTPDCMHTRNRYMVDQADLIIAVWDSRPSGTAELTAMHMTMTIIPSSVAIAIMGRTVRTIAGTMSRMRSARG